MATTTTTISSITPNPVAPTVTVTITAQVVAGSGPNPSSGEVQFYDNSVAIGSPMGVNSLGFAILTTSFDTTGIHPILAVFAGTTGYDPSTSYPVPLTVSQIPTTTTVISYTNPADAGVAVTFTATVDDPDGGTVTFTDTFNSVITPLATIDLYENNTVNYTTFADDTLPLGSHLITATYNGDAIYESSVGTLTQTIVVPSGSVAYLPSFALIGNYSTSGDGSLPPTASSAAVPNTTTSGTPIFIVWSSSNIIQVRITGNNTIDPAVDSGLINTTGSGSYEISAGFTHTISLTFNAYDTIGHVAVTQTIPVTIT
jgi:hypothetical protein